MTKSTGVGRGNYKRKPGLRRNRLTQAEKNALKFVEETKMKVRAVKKQRTYKRKRSVPRARLSANGVNGAVALMSAGPQLPQEIKTVETLTIIDTPGTGNWHYLNSTGALLAAVRNGPAANQRIGKKIRVIGVILRGTANTLDQTIVNSSGSEPYTIDMIWDKQCNGAIPAITIPYTTAAAQSLPNSLYQDRFQFAKRLESQGNSSATSNVNMIMRCSKLIDYVADTGAITDLLTTNLLVTFSCNDTAPTFIGTLRILYVDA